MGSDVNSISTVLYYMPSVLAIINYLLMTPLCVTCNKAGGTFFPLETRSCYIALASLELMALLLPQPSDHRHAPPYPHSVHCLTYKDREQELFWGRNRETKSHIYRLPLPL